MTTPTKTPAAPPLPDEIEANLEALLTMTHAFSDLERKAAVRFLYNTFRSHIQAQAAEIERLRQESARARLDALRWALRQWTGGSASLLNPLFTRIEAEIARLERAAPAPPPSEAASGQEGRG